MVRDCKGRHHFMRDDGRFSTLPFFAAGFFSGDSVDFVGDAAGFLATTTSLITTASMRLLLAQLSGDSVGE